MDCQNNTLAQAYKLADYIANSRNITADLLSRIHEDYQTRDIQNSIIISLEDQTVAQLPSTIIIGGLKNPDDEVLVWPYETWRDMESSNLTTEYDRRRFFRSTKLANLRRKVKEHLQYSFVARATADERGEHVIKFSFVSMNAESSVVLGIRQEITKSLEHDFLTGGLNREGLLRELNQKLQARSPEDQLSVLCFNIKGFRVINELHGSVIGDKVLQHMYTSLVYSELNPLSYARTESDNFVCLIRREDLDTDVITRLCQQECVVGTLKVHYRCLCGIFHVAGDVSAFTAYAHSRLAISHIKDQFITPWIVFKPEMQQIAISDSEVLNEIEGSIERHEFSPYFQPMVQTQTGRVVMAEALVRWKSQKLGLVMPGTFVPVLERNGGLSRIDQIMEQSVFNLLQLRLAQGRKVVPIDLNLSWCDFADANLIGQLRRHIEDRTVPTDLLRFEITETAYEEIADNRVDMLDFFQKNNVKLLVDDFGQGYSFGTMKNVDFYIVKLDKSLIDKLGQSRKMDLLVKSFVDVFHSLNAQVVAEGVETELQVNYLREIECDYIQGNYFYEPMDEASFCKLLDEQGEEIVEAAPSAQTIATDESLLQADTPKPHEMASEEADQRMTVDAARCMRMLLDEMDIHVFEWDVKTHEDIASEKFCRMYGMESNVIKQMPEFCPLVLEEDQERFRAFYQRVEHGEKMGSDCFRLYKPDGKGYTWYCKTFYTLFDENGRPQKGIITMRDCQDEYRFRMLRTRDRMLTLQQEIVTFIYTLADDTMNITYRTKQGGVATASMSDFLHTDPEQMLPDQANIAAQLRNIIESGTRSGYFDFYFDAMEVEYRAHFAMVDGEYGHLYAIIGQAEDINKTRERLEAKEQLIRMADVDGLTQLLNRSAGEREMRKLLQTHTRGVFGILDCDKFKCVNDTFGHQVGDALLVAIAGVMNELNPTGISMRLGGDEFAFFIQGYVTPAKVQARADRFFAKLSTLDVPGMKDFPVFVSMGAVIYEPEEDEDFDSLYHKADLLLYESKKYPGNKLTMK